MSAALTLLAGAAASGQATDATQGTASAKSTAPANAAPETPTKRAAVNVKKALNAAIADAEQAEADVTQLFVAESRVGDGGMFKRFQPKDRGRAHPIEKRFSNIVIGVEERAAKA